MFLGIDPGKTGGVALLSAEGKLVKLSRFDGGEPADLVREMLELVDCPGDDLAIGLELVHAMPGQGVTSMFTFGVGLGRIQGMLMGLGLPWRDVAPQSWQKWLPEGEDAKGRVKAYAAGAWGLEAFILPGCRVPHQGCLDAAVIAEYLRRLGAGTVQPPVVRAKAKRRQPIKLAG